LVPQFVPAAACWQVPELLQVPVWQLAEVPQAESATPAFFVVHPDPSLLQAWQAPEQALEQQILEVPAMLSTHLPLAQSVPLVQAAPAAFFAPQTSPSQAAELSQVLLVPETQAPAPSQVLGVRVEPVQVEPQPVPLAPYWHLPAPSHMPVVPQVVFAAVQILWPAWPAGTGRHCPSLCPFRVFVHAEQPLQSLLQQTPSATIPDVH
jgi:hypothetical protein